MAIKLTLGKPLFALYDEHTSQYVYADGADYRLSDVPKPSGMSVTIEKSKAKLTKLIGNLERFSEEGGRKDLNPSYRFEAGEPGPFANISKAKLEEIRARNRQQETEMYAARAKYASNFIIVKIGVEKV